jgi:uncharacterized iron-regulated membrane protein
VRTLHRWFGLVVGLGLTVSGLTGSALVFRQEIDSALNPGLLVVQPAATRATLQSVLDRVHDAYPGETPTRIRMPQHADGTYEFWMGAAPDRYVYADPYRGTLLGDRRPTEFLTGWLFLLHTELLGGAVGKQVVGVGGFALMLLSLTGLATWWPRRGTRHRWGAWRSGMVVKRGNAKRVTHDLHRAVGFYASLFLFVAGLTGASLVFPSAFERAAHLVAGTQPAGLPSTTRSAAVLSNATLPIDSLLAIAEHAQPGGVISYIYLPTSPSEAFRVRKRLPGEKHPNGKSFVHVESSTGRVLAVENGVTAPRGARLYSILYPIHIGTLAGVPSRLLALLVGLSLPLLALTGTLIWWRRRSRLRPA